EQTVLQQNPGAATPAPRDSAVDLVMAKRAPTPTPAPTLIPTVVPAVPPAPVQVSPASGSVFNNFPRTTTVTWQAAAGASGYFVEVDCFGCCGNAWCTDVGRTFSVS